MARIVVISFLFVIVCGVLLVFGGCATIPSEAAELSQELGNRLSAIESANLALLGKFFDEKRRQVDEFIMEEWVPAFAEEVFSSPQIAAAWDEIVRSDDKEERLKLLVNLGPKLQAKINAKRIEMVKPLDDLERVIKRKLRNEYDQAKAINNSLTSFLLSASKVEEHRSRYLEMVGVTDAEIANTIDMIDSGVNTLLNSTRSVNDKSGTISEYKAKLEKILESLRNG